MQSSPENLQSSERAAVLSRHKIDVKEDITL